MKIFMTVYRNILVENKINIISVMDKIPLSKGLSNFHAMPCNMYHSITSKLTR